MKYLITGLGNIGPEYHETRHNIGFMVLDHMANKKDIAFEPDRYGDTCTLKFRGRQLILLKPSTYMNLSGKAVRFHLDKHKIPVERSLVITDDIALPFGRLRLRPKGSDGGHNGLKHIQELLGSNQYPRLRFGVGSDFPKGQQVRYVLEPFSTTEWETLPERISTAAKGVERFVIEGIGRAMNHVNAK